MKKTMIALAVAAAMPVAAQADVTLSGSVEATYNDAGNNEFAMDSNLTASASEVLTNGMTASASFDVLQADTNVSGTAGLSGDFGSVTFSSGTNVNGGADLGDVAGQIAQVDERTDADDAATGNGIAYTGSFAGLNLAITRTSDSDAAASTVSGFDGLGSQDAGYTSVGATYDFNGVTVGVAQIKADAASTSAVGATYSFGDLSVYGGSSEGDTTIGADYSMAIDALAIDVNVEDAAGASSWEVDATYTIGAISVGVNKEDGAEVLLSASYTSGPLTVAYSEDDAEVTVDYDMGNADINVTRDTDADSTSLSYTVSF